MYDELLATCLAVGRDLGAALALAPALPTVSHELPLPLREVYARCDGGDIGFGDIYRQSEVLAHRCELPFAPRWIPFGDDRRGTFWLCATAPFSGRWFTTWDHEEQVPIGDPLYDSLGTLLTEQYDRYLETTGDDCVRIVVEYVPDPSRARAAIELRRLAEMTTNDMLATLKSLPAIIACQDALSARRVVRELQALGISCHLKIDWL